MSVSNHDAATMDLTTSSLLADLPKLLCLAIALAGACFAAGTWWRRQRSSAIAGVQGQAAPTSSSKILYRDAPTVRVVDSQRVDRVRKIARLAKGECVDVLDRGHGPIPRLRITLNGLLTEGDAPAACIFVEYGGTVLSCGPLVQEVGHNEFVLPRTARDEPRTSVMYFHERGDSLDFMRIKLRAIDATSGTAELDVMQVSGHWPAT